MYYNLSVRPLDLAPALPPAARRPPPAVRRPPSAARRPSNGPHSEVMRSSATVQWGSVGYTIPLGLGRNGWTVELYSYTAVLQAAGC